MNKKIKEKWVNALRSNEYIQRKNLLKCDGKFCVQGVLVDIYIKEDQENRRWRQDNYDDGRELCGCNYAIMPDDVIKWAGFETSELTRCGFSSILTYNEETISISHLNDWEGLTFEQLATLINEQY